MKFALKTLAGLAATFLFVVVVLYINIDAPPPVLATVVDDPELPSIEVDGVRLHAEAFGPEHAPLVIVLHGGPGNDFQPVDDASGTFWGGGLTVFEDGLLVV